MYMMYVYTLYSSVWCIDTVYKYRLYTVHLYSVDTFLMLLPLLLPIINLIIMTKIWGGGQVDIFCLSSKKLGGGTCPPVPYTPPAHAYP